MCEREVGLAMLGTVLHKLRIMHKQDNVQISVR